MRYRRYTISRRDSTETMYFVTENERNATIQRNIETHTQSIFSNAHTRYNSTAFSNYIGNVSGQ